MSDSQHHPFLRECFKLARQALDSKNPPFGAVLVDDGKILLSAYNTSHSDRDPTKHAELNLVTAAFGQITPKVLSRATLYAGNEPCPMCSGAIYWSGIRKVVYGSSREALTKIRSFGLNVPCRDILSRGTDAVEVTGPLLEAEVLNLYQEYYQA